MKSKWYRGRLSNKIYKVIDESKFMVFNNKTKTFDRHLDIVISKSLHPDNLTELYVRMTDDEIMLELI